MNNVRILAVYGHPDDEGQVTGTLASFIAQGAQVTLVCATRGEVGEIHALDPGEPGRHPGIEGARPHRDLLGSDVDDVDAD